MLYFLVRANHNWPNYSTTSTLHKINMISPYAYVVENGYKYLVRNDHVHTILPSTTTTKRGTDLREIRTNALCKGSIIHALGNRALQHLGDCGLERITYLLPSEFAQMIKFLCYKYTINYIQLEKGCGMPHLTKKSLKLCWPELAFRYFVLENIRFNVVSR